VSGQDAVMSVTSAIVSGQAAVTGVTSAIVSGQAAVTGVTSAIVSGQDAVTGVTSAIVSGQDASGGVSAAIDGGRKASASTNRRDCTTPRGPRGVPPACRARYCCPSSSTTLTSIESNGSARTVASPVALTTTR
jgi:hypothetical protein